MRNKTPNFKVGDLVRHNLNDAMGIILHFYAAYNDYKVYWLFKDYFTIVPEREFEKLKAHQ